jgi:hypothetical protein
MVQKLQPGHRRAHLLRIEVPNTQFGTGDTQAKGVVFWLSAIKPNPLARMQMLAPHHLLEIAGPSDAT